MKRLGRIWTVIVYLFLYAPMFILFIGSFNDGKDLSEFEGFTLGNYADLFRNSHLVGLLGNSVLLALCSAVLATLLGTLAALGIKAMRGRLRRLVMSLTNIPLVNPEIVTGVSLALLFVFIGRRMLSTENVFGFATLLIAHVTFCLPYVILSVMPKLRQLDPNIYEAAQDLGDHGFHAFRSVILPEIMPGVVNGLIIAFTLSIDDFVISYFTAGAQTQTLSMVIYSMAKKRVSPEINALSTLLFAAVVILMVIVNLRQASQERRRKMQQAALTAHS